MRVIEGVSHVSVAVPELDEAARSYALLLDASCTRFSDGGGRSCASFDLGAISFVLVDAEQRSGLDAIGLRVSVLARASSGLSRCGLDVEQPFDARGPDNQSWREAPIAPASTHGIPLSLGERSVPVAKNAGVILDHIVIRTPNPERAIALYGGRLGLDMRLDRSNPAWNARLMFFRCGDTVVELAHVLSDGVSDGPDIFGGLSWRMPDIDAAHARLTEAGFALSPIRTGRRPGSRVCTVRDGTSGVPTILLGLDAPS